MTTESWAKVEELFQAALEKAPEDRVAFLSAACPDDAEVRSEVESLLVHAGSSGSFLEGGAVRGSLDIKPVLIAGQKLDRFEIIELLGRGGMGEVYRARDQRLHRDIAIKVLRSLRSLSEAQRRRFIQEAETASALSHPNIITIHDVGEADGTPYIAMECVAGQTLAALIGPGRLPTKEAVRIALQIARALEKAHRAGIIHRDLKPGNVMVNPENVVKVLDFGVAKAVLSGRDEAPGGPSTTAGTILGTVDYMSPEQVEGQRLDARSDIFSFGSVLYEMLSGGRPFQGESGVSTLVSILTKEPLALPATVPSGLQEVVCRCLRKSRDERFADMGEVRVALEEISPQLEPGRRPRPPYIWLRRGMAIGLALICVAMVVLWKTKRNPEPPPQAVPFTSYPGAEQHPSFSPDGSKIAFSWDGEKEENYNIYVKTLGSATPVRLTSGPENDLSPAFSPDGRWVGFVRVGKGRASFMSVPVVGGEARVLSPWTSSLRGCAACNLFSWFPDGRHIVTSGLELLAIDSGEKRVLTSPPNPVNPDECPAVSPDGRTVAFVRMPALQLLDLWALDLNKDLEPRGNPRRLTHRRFNPAPFSLDPAWTWDGRDILFSDGRIWRVPASRGGELRALPFEGYSPVMSRSDKLAYVRFDQNVWDLRRVALADPGRAAGEPAPFALSTGGDMNPQYSPDGRHVAFESARSGQQHVWISEADGSNAVPLPVRPDMYEGSPRWSPDGKFLCFDSNSSGQWHVYVVPAGGGTAKRVTADSASHNVPTWSRDGNSIYFASTATGRTEIWKIPWRGGRSEQVTTQGGFEGWESMDGKSLYFTKEGAGDQGLWRLSLETGDEQQIAAAIRYWSFAVTRQGVYYISQGKSGRKDSLEYFSFATKKTTRVIDLERRGDAGLTESPDGRFLVYAQSAKSNSDIMLVENFR
jgi:serine/threonine protein kinase